MILDSPPVRAVADPAILSSLLDATLLVVEAGRTRRGWSGRPARPRRANARVLGVVLNRLAHKPIDGYGRDSDSTARAGPAVGVAVADPVALGPATSRR